MNIGREVAQEMRREGENKVFKLLVATVRGSTSSKEEEERERHGGRGRERDRDGGLGGEKEGEPERSAVRILISSNWSLREQKLGDEETGSGREGAEQPVFDRVISLLLCSSLFPSALFDLGLLCPPLPLPQTHTHTLPPPFSPPPPCVFYRPTVFFTSHWLPPRIPNTVNIKNTHVHTHTAELQDV